MSLNWRTESIRDHEKLLIHVPCHHTNILESLWAHTNNDFLTVFNSQLTNLHFYLQKQDMKSYSAVCYTL